MKKSQIGLLLLALGLIAGLYFLPKVVVNKTSDGEKITKTESNPEKQTEKSNDSAHSSSENSELPADLLELRTQVKNTSGAKKNALQLKLAEALFKLQKFDSAGLYYETITDEKNQYIALEKAGDAYYEALTFAVNKEKADRMAEKARATFKKILEQNPKNYKAKAKMAMTFVGTENPMQGILMLREVVQEDPKNEFAVYNLGILSFQSGQYDKAESRFLKLSQLNPKDVNAFFYLGLSQKELGKKKEAIANLMKAKTLDKSPEVQASIDEQLEELNK